MKNLDELIVELRKVYDDLNELKESNKEKKIDDIDFNKIKNNNCVINREYYKNSYKNFKKGRKCDIMKICKKIQGGIWKCAWVQL